MAACTRSPSVALSARLSDCAPKERPGSPGRMAPEDVIWGRIRPVREQGRYLARWPCWPPYWTNRSPASDQPLLRKWHGGGEPGREPGQGGAGQAYIAGGVEMMGPRVAMSRRRRLSLPTPTFKDLFRAAGHQRRTSSPPRYGQTAIKSDAGWIPAVEMGAAPPTKAAGNIRGPFRQIHHAGPGSSRAGLTIQQRMTNSMRPAKPRSMIATTLEAPPIMLVWFRY